MNIKHLFFYMLLIAFSSCSKPGYEKAIAEWVQPYSGVQQKKTASFLLSPDKEKCIGKLKSASK